MIIDRSQKIFTIPNILSLFRIGILPVFVYTYLNASTRQEYLTAAFLFFLSSISDCLDGFTARKFNMVTELGKLLDPVADKLTQVTLLFCLASRFPYMWSLAIICLIKDLFMTVMGIIMIKYRQSKLNGAKWYGKVSTAYTYVVILLLLLFPQMNQQSADTLIITGEFLMILSIVMYMGVFKKMWKGEN